MLPTMFCRDAPETAAALGIVPPLATRIEEPQRPAQGACFSASSSNGHLDLAAFKASNWPVTGQAGAEQIVLRIGGYTGSMLGHPEDVLVVDQGFGTDTPSIERRHRARIMPPVNLRMPVCKRVPRRLTVVARGPVHDLPQSFRLRSEPAVIDAILALVQEDEHIHW